MKWININGKLACVDETRVRALFPGNDGHMERADMCTIIMEGCPPVMLGLRAVEVAKVLGIDVPQDTQPAKSAGSSLKLHLPGGSS